MHPTHRKATSPGEILLEEFMKPAQMTIPILAHKLDITTEKLNQIIYGVAPITEEIAQNLSIIFKTSTEFWINLQQNFDRT